MLIEGSQMKNKHVAVSETIQKSQLLPLIDHVEMNLLIKMMKVKNMVTKNLKKNLQRGDLFKHT